MPSALSSPNLQLDSAQFAAYTQAIQLAVGASKGGCMGMGIDAQIVAIKVAIGVVLAAIIGLIVAQPIAEKRKYRSENGLAVVWFYGYEGNRMGEERRVPLVRGRDLHGDQFVTEALLSQASALEPDTIIVVMPGGETIRIHPSDSLNAYGKHPAGVELLAQSICDEYRAAADGNFCRWIRWGNLTPAAIYPPGGVNP